MSQEQEQLHSQFETLHTQELGFGYAEMASSTYGRLKDLPDSRAQRAYESSRDGRKYCLDLSLLDDEYGYTITRFPKSTGLDDPKAEVLKITLDPHIEGQNMVDHDIWRAAIVKPRKQDEGELEKLVSHRLTNKRTLTVEEQYTDPLDGRIAELVPAANHEIRKQNVAHRIRKIFGKRR